MDVMDQATGELRDIEQQRLFGEFAEVEIFELGINGSGLDGDESFEVGQNVTLTISGRVVGMQHLVRKDKEDPEGMRELLVRKAVIKVYSAKRA